MLQVHRLGSDFKVKIKINSALQKLKNNSGVGKRTMWAMAAATRLQLKKKIICTSTMGNEALAKYDDITSMIGL